VLAHGGRCRGGVLQRDERAGARETLHDDPQHVPGLRERVVDHELAVGSRLGDERDPEQREAQEQACQAGNHVS
jgi:hypothetical protein